MSTSHVNRSLDYNRERHLMYVPQGGGQIEIHRYTADDMVEVFADEQLVELNHLGKTGEVVNGGVWIDMIWAALHYEKLAEAAALGTSTGSVQTEVGVPPFSPSTFGQTGGEMA